MYVNGALAVVLLAFPVIAAAQVFRCTNAAGKVEYSDTSCEGGGGRRVIVNQNVLPGLAVSPSLPTGDVQVPRVDPFISNGVSGNVSGPAQTFGRTEADLAAEKGGSTECARAKRNYEIATSSIQPNRNTDADELSMYSACGIRPPDKTIVNITNVHFVGMPRPSRITSCDRQGCLDDRGNRYQRRNGGGFIGPRGACTQVGSRLDCP